jgi:hypothetical protein
VLATDKYCAIRASNLCHCRRTLIRNKRNILAEGGANLERDNSGLDRFAEKIVPDRLIVLVEHF